MRRAAAVGPRRASFPESRAATRRWHGSVMKIGKLWFLALLVAGLLLLCVSVVMILLGTFAGWSFLVAALVALIPSSVWLWRLGSNRHS